VDRERKTAWLVLSVRGGFIAAVIANYIVAQYVMRGYPYSTFLYLAAVLLAVPIARGCRSCSTTSTSGRSSIRCSWPC